MTPARVRVLVPALALSGLLNACVGDSVTVPPSGGGQRNQPYGCSVGALTNSWTQARLNGNRDLPERCPFLVDAPTTVDFAASLYGPKETTPASGGATLNGIRSVYDQHTVVGSQNRYWFDDPNVSTGRTLQFTGGYFAGYFVPGGQQPWSHDSGSVTADTHYGPAEAFITMSGAARVFGGDLLVSGNAATGALAAFRAYTDVDTNAYKFSWRIDGVSIKNNDADLTYTFWKPGNHEVIAFASYLTGVDTIRKTVWADFVASVSGPAQVSPYESNTWSAAIPGGYPPYTYQWYIDNNPAGTGSSITASFPPETQHHLTFEVWDSQGFYTTAAQPAFWVHVSSGNCPPNDPNCVEYSRVPVVRSLPKAPR